MSDSLSKSIDYASSGVDIDAGNRLVEAIKPAVARTRQAGSVDGLGGFGGLFAVPRGYRDPLLVAGTDGVGTKLELACEHGAYQAVGQDLVAMCVNDVIVQGAKPLFFLDYIATGKLEHEVAVAVIEGIATALEACDCALIGGETAEMPGFYPAGRFDLAGFCVGIVERARVITGQDCLPGDQVIGIDASGPHSNGFSLIRRLLQHAVEHQVAIPEDLLAWLLTPTQLYVRPVLDVLANESVKALAHITGGGLVENVTRVMPKSTALVVDTNSWQVPPHYRWLQATGQVADREMLRTFNMGIGFCIITNPGDCEAVLARLRNDHQLGARVIGKVIEAHDNERVNFV